MYLTFDALSSETEINVSLTTESYVILRYTNKICVLHTDMLATPLSLHTQHYNTDCALRIRKFIYTYVR